MLAPRRRRASTTPAPPRAPGEYHGIATRGNIEVGSVNGMVAKSEAQYDGIFDENRRGPGMRESTQSRIKFENGVLVAEREGAHDGIFEKPEEDIAKRRNSTRTTRRARPSVSATAG